MNTKKIAGIGIIALVGVAGVYFASRGDGNGGGGLGEGIGQTIMGSGTGGLTAKGEAVKAIVAAREAEGFVPYTPTKTTSVYPTFPPVTPKTVRKGGFITSNIPSYVPHTPHIPSTMYEPPAGYMPISGTAPAKGKKTVLPSIQPSQYIGASTTLTAGEMRAAGVSRTQAGLTSKGLATQARIAARTKKQANIGA